MNSIDTFDEPEDKQGGDIRLQVFLANAGVCSRRGAVEILKEGRVVVNGTVIREPGFRVRPDDEVVCDGSVVKPRTNHVYVVLHKPIGYVCSHDDPEGRDLAIDLLGPWKDQRLFSVGRLDFLTSGIIFFTNDGNFSNLVSHPSSGIEKEYLVEAKKDITTEFLEEFKKGIYVDGERYRIQAYRMLSPRVVSLILTEGKNREIRNAFAARKVTIKKLQRIRIGQVKLGDLPVGKYRILKPAEVEWFMNHSQRKTHGRRS